MLSYIVVSGLPLAASALAHASGRVRPARLLIAVAALAAAFLAVGRAFPQVQVSEVQLSFDPLSRLAYTSLLMLAALCILYGWLSRGDEGLMAIGLAVTGILGLAFSLSSDLLTAGLVFEFAALAGAFGIGLRRGAEGARTLAMRYVSYVVMAGVCLAGVFSLATRFEVTRDPMIEHVAFAFLSFFLLIVLGAFPVSLWYPRTLERGDLMMVALLVSVLSIGGTWLFVQTYASFPWLMLDQRPVQVLMAIATMGTVATSLMAVTQRRLDHLIAYTVASNAGVVVVGIATGTPLGIAGGLFTLLNCLWATILMLMCLDISKRPQGLRRTSATVMGLCVGGIALAGAPPTGAFVGRWMIYEASASQSGYFAFLLIASSAIVFLAYARLLGSVLASAAAGEERGDEPIGSAVMVVLLAILSLAVGVYPTPILQAISDAIAGMSHL